MCVGGVGMEYREGGREEEIGMKLRGRKRGRRGRDPQYHVLAKGIFSA